MELRTDLSGTGEWLPCDALLADPARFGPWHKRLAEWLHGEYGQAPGRTAAGYVMTWYLRVPAYAAALLLHHERRVPSLRPADLAFRLGGQRPDPDGIALIGADFHCLPSDPGATLPQATVVPDEHALAAALRAGYAAHADRFVAAYTTVTRLGRRTLWAAATDALTALNTIDYHDPGPALDRWIQVTTGQFGKNLSGDRQLQLDRAVTSRTIATASVRQAAVTELDEGGGTARVIAVVDIQLSTNGSAAAPSRSRLNVTLTRTESGWKISAVQGAG
ncbi:hypothetical protein FNH05_24295 [Amycolatopsis rhizosphaerae]|uniref:Uncharacterized protein n=1 Tax=Amycolatopsis rhizosphaerae TaxID=2053003 RepID=A0A558BQC6_9PSEU|nr:hypothetical protein [Amycolatopsis rhizosphaerae]TVT38724.1 hypothetical protein FNH05_24295 [Amycolatopsis rhizosphaerae]